MTKSDMFISSGLGFNIFENDMENGAFAPQEQNYAPFSFFFSKGLNKIYLTEIFHFLSKMM